MRHGLCTWKWKTLFQNKIISLRFRKNVVFRVITELTENLVGVRRTIIRYFIIRTIFYTFWCMLCCHTSILKPTVAITKEYRQEMYEMLFFCQRLHISSSVKWLVSCKHNFFGHGIVPRRVPYKLHFAKLKFAY